MIDGISYFIDFDHGTFKDNSFAGEGGGSLGMGNFQLPYALNAMMRAINNQTSLYDMTDTNSIVGVKRAIDLLPSIVTASEAKNVMTLYNKLDKYQKAYIDEYKPENHTNGGVTVTGIPPYVKLTAVQELCGSEPWNKVSGQIDGKLISLYEFKLTNTLTGENYVLDNDEVAAVTLPRPAFAGNLGIVYEKDDGTFEYLMPQSSDNTLKFNLNSVSLVGVVAESNGQTQILQQANSSAQTADSIQNTNCNPDTGDKLPAFPMILLVTSVSIFLICAHKNARNGKKSS